MAGADGHAFAVLVALGLPILAEHRLPRQAGIDWAQFREAQREPARASVASALVLDAIARREGLSVSEQEIGALRARMRRTQGVQDTDAAVSRG